MFIPLVLIVLFISFIVRRVTSPFRYGYRPRRWNGSNSYYNNPYQYGCRRNHGLLGGVLPILALVALDRIFNRRSW